MPTANQVVSMMQAASAAKHLRRFISNSQLEAMGNGCRGEERDWFKSKFVELSDLILNMPKTYEQDGKGDAAIVYLHYFKGSADWYITERDMEVEQYQAYGLADLGYGGELGYINIEELVENGVELDLHWTPKPLRSVKAVEA